MAHMAILVDAPIWRWRGRRWSHLVSDRALDELHDFADQLGLSRGWFQCDHYDVPASVRELAILKGAVPVSASELVLRLRAAGLRHGSRVGGLAAEPPVGWYRPTV